MTTAFGAPMEALAISYLAHGVLNVWTWLAFLTAALSFWKIKSSIQPSSPPQPPPSPSPPQTSAEPDPDDQEDQLPSTTNRTSILASPTTSYRLEKTRSGKFSVYYGHNDTNIEAIGTGIEDVGTNIEDDGIVIGSLLSNYYQKNKYKTLEDLNSQPSCPFKGIIRVDRSRRRMMGLIKHHVEVDGWEALLKLKTTDMGWYRYQDLTVLDGSVVRLWNQFSHVVQE